MFVLQAEYCNADRTTWKLTLQDIETDTERSQNRAGETAVYGYNPHPIFLEVPPGIFGRFLGHKRQVIVLGVPFGHRGNWDYKGSLRDRSHVCLGKIKFRAFPKRVGPRILSLESVDYFKASEYYWVVEKK